MVKWIFGLIVVLILAGAAAWWSGLISLGTPSQEATSTPQTQTQPQAEAPLNGMSNQNDSSDAALQQDAAAVDAQIQGLTQDSASVDSSLNDKSVQ